MTLMLVFWLVDLLDFARIIKFEFLKGVAMRLRYRSILAPVKTYRLRGGDKMQPHRASSSVVFIYIYIYILVFTQYATCMSKFSVIKIIC